VGIAIPIPIGVAVETRYRVWAVILSVTEAVTVAIRDATLLAVTQTISVRVVAGIQRARSSVITGHMEIQIIGNLLRA